VLHASTQQQSELPLSANQLSDLCSLDQPNHSFQGYAVSIEPMNSRGKGDFLGSWRGNTYDPWRQKADTQTA
jgi:hypothetical protein